MSFTCSNPSLTLIDTFSAPLIQPGCQLCPANLSIQHGRLRGDDLWLSQYQYRLIALAGDLRVGYAVPRHVMITYALALRTAQLTRRQMTPCVCACVRYRRINCSIIVSAPSVGFTHNCRACAVRAHPYLKWNRIIFTSKLYQTAYGYYAACPALLAEKSIIIASKLFVCCNWWIWHLK